MVDADHNILYANDAYARLVGVRPAEMERRLRAGKRCFEELPLSICRTDCAMARSRAAGCSVQLDEVSAARAQGEALRLSVRAVPIAGIGYLETYRDVTAEAQVQERYRGLLRAAEAANAHLERRVAERTHELEEANRELRRAQAQLVHAEKMIALGQLVAGIAHELNNPLNFISCNVAPLREHVAGLLALIGALEKNVPDTPAARLAVAREKEAADFDFIRDDAQLLLGSISEGARRAASIVSDLRTFSRSSDSTREVVDLAEAIRTTARIATPLFGDRIRLELSIGPLPPIHGNAGQLNQVLLNLLSNAVHATPGQGAVRVDARTVGDDAVEVAVIDQGVGIAPEVLPRIFDPFFTTKPPGQGTGLGLSISYSIVAEHGGSIRVEPTPGGGTTFTIRLPLRARPPAPRPTSGAP